jgi:hypothetical protein
MEGEFSWLAEAGISVYLRNARWGYAAVNAAHILGIALLVGAILPLDLRLLGCWPGIPRRHLVQVLVPVASAGLALALVTGALLFSVRPAEYAALGVFQLKLLLVGLAVVSALALHIRYGWSLDDAGPGHLRLAAGLSMACWVGALVLGRMIAFAGD